MPVPTLTAVEPVPNQSSMLSKVGVVALYAAFLTALLFLMVSHGSIDAPMRKPSNTYTPLAEIEAELKSADLDPRPAEIHFDISDRMAIPKTTANFLTRVYYTAQYLRYPHRILIGRDDQIINNERQMLAVDDLPPLDWMRQHQLGSIYTVHDQGMIGPRISVMALP